MAICIICQNKDPQPWFNALKALEPTLDIRIWPDEGDAAEIDFALTWQHPSGLLQRYPNLKTVSSLGAGVDHILQDPQLPEKIRIVRIIDPGLVTDMIDYLDMAIASFRHHQLFYHHQQVQKNWSPQLPIEKSSLTIGVMGLGQIGSEVAEYFAAQQFRVVGWSSSEKQIAGAICFVGPNQLSEFFQHCNIVINLLPLTDLTRGILNQGNIAQLKQPAYLINVGRGSHLVEADLIELLKQGKLNGACLDVFCEEPLPASHAFYQQPKISITPHVSSLTRPKAVAQQILLNYRRSQSDQQLLNEVDRSRGY